MPTHPGRHYEHAPIAEAIVEIRCDLPDGVGLEELAAVVDQTEFPKSEKAMEVEGRFDLTQDGSFSSRANARQVGHVFRRADGKVAVNARTDRFVLSWLAPYERWESFVAEAERYWLRYRTVARPTTVTRLGVRFVNRIAVPSPQIEIKDYLRVAVEVPAYLPQGISSYFLQVNVPMVDLGTNATITSTLLAPTEGTTSLLLDIDAWEETQIDLADDEEAASIQEHLEGLRRTKNYVFEACITDATRGLIV